PLRSRLHPTRAQANLGPSSMTSTSADGPRELPLAHCDELRAKLGASRALVVGLGASGRAAIELLVQLGLEVHAYDAKTPVQAPVGASLFVGAEVPADAFAGVDLIVLSPGVPPTRPRELAARHAPEARIEGEMSLAVRVAGDAGLRPQLVLVTGTNGKSTITALTAHLIEAAGRTAFAGGNLGVPLSHALLGWLRAPEPSPPEFWVLECSSYQLETYPSDALIETDVAILANVSADHLSRYRDLEHYAETKTQIFANLRRPTEGAVAGLALLSAEDAMTPRLRPAATTTVECIGDAKGAHLEADALVLPNDLRWPRERLRLAGRHNAMNALFALRAVVHLGLDPQCLAAGLESFEGLPHRMVFVAERAGVRYYSDSKATNVASTLAGVSGFEHPFVLSAGGQLKGEPLEPLIAVLEAEA